MGCAKCEINIQLVLIQYHRNSIITGPTVCNFEYSSTDRDKGSFISRNIAQATLRMIYFHYKQYVFSIKQSQKTLNLTLKKASPIWTNVSASEVFFKIKYFFLLDTLIL